MMICYFFLWNLMSISTNFVCTHSSAMQTLRSQLWVYLTIFIEHISNIRLTKYVTNTHTSEESEKWLMLGHTHITALYPCLLLLYLISHVHKWHFFCTHFSAIHSLGSPLWGDGGSLHNHGEDNQVSLLQFLLALRATLRTAFSVCLLTVPSHLFQVLCQFTCCLLMHPNVRDVFRHWV